MEVNQDAAAAAAAAAAGGPSDNANRTRQGSKSTAKQLGAQKLSEANAELLDLTVEDEGLESIRRSVLDILNVKLPQAPPPHVRCPPQGLCSCISAGALGR
jgi:hypothetical protein